MSLMGGGVGATGGTGIKGVINSGACHGVGDMVMAGVGVMLGTLAIGVTGEGLGGDTVVVAVTIGVVSL